MKNARIIYRLINDLLRYLLKYACMDTYTETDIEQALAESGRICEVYKNAPHGIGFLARKLCVAVNSYFSELEKKEKEKKDMRNNEQKQR